MIKELLDRSKAIATNARPLLDAGYCLISATELLEMAFFGIYIRNYSLITYNAITTDTNKQAFFDNHFYVKY